MVTAAKRNAASTGSGAAGDSMPRVYYTDCHEKICPVCQKNFIVPPGNVYKERRDGDTLHFCSWTCLTKWRKDNKRTYRNAVPIVSKSKSGKVIREYPTITQAADEMGCSNDYIKARLESGYYDDRNECYWRYK